MALVSVVLPSYKMGRFVAAALDSVGSQTHAEWEVILVDDHGPEDGTRGAVEDFARRHPSRRVEYVRNPENVGCGQSRNVGIAAAKGEILAFLDPDDSWEPRHLERGLHALSGADISFCKCRAMDEHGNDLGPHLGGRVEELVASFPRSLYWENFLLPSTTVLTRRKFDLVGAFASRDVATNAADWDFYLRCVAAGFRFSFLPEELCRYRRHDGGATGNYLTITRACVRVLGKNRRAADGHARKELSGSLHKQLCKLAYLEISFRRWAGLKHALHALWLKPFDFAPFTEFAKGMRNNWKHLR